jgi:hypothetical protein
MASIAKRYICSCYVLNTLYLITCQAKEVVFGLTAHSVALPADDSAHNFGDVSACCWHWAAWLRRRHASLTNAAVLLVGVGGITVEGDLGQDGGLLPDGILKAWGHLVFK